MILHPLIVRFGLVALVCASIAARDPQPEPQGAVPLPAYNVRDELVRGFTISYGMKYLWWGTIDDVSFEDVDAGSLPAKVGIKSGDRILTINGKAVREMKRKEMEQVLFRNGVTLKLVVRTGNAPPRTVELTWPAVSWDPKLGRK
jgi:hypothetical protein